MRRIPSINIYKKAVGLAAVGLFVFATVIVVGGPISGHAVAAAKKSTAPAKCAILNQGSVDCPPNSSNPKVDLQKGKCYYKDPGKPNAGMDGWQDLPCDSDAFKTATQPQVGESADPALSCSAQNCDLVKKYVDPLVTALAACVGVVVTISIVVGGIQYSSAAGEPQKAAQAKGRIINALYALLAFFLLFAALEWFLPGGLLNG